MTAPISLLRAMYVLTYEWFPVEPLHPVEPLAVGLVLAVVLLPLLAQEGVADAAASHRTLLVALGAVARRRRVRAQEREVWLRTLHNTHTKLIINKNSVKTENFLEENLLYGLP